MISSAVRSTHHARARRFAWLIALCAVASAVACGSAGAAFPPGSLLAFGSNVYGELGSSLNLGTAKANPTPAMVVLPGATGNVTDAATGDGYSLVLTGTGQVYSFGVNTYGQLGTSTNLGTQNPNPTPALVTFPGLSGQVSSVAGGGNSSLALTSTGQVYGFGSDAEGELGTPPVSGSQNNEPTPTLISLPGLQGQAVQIATGVYHSLVLSSAGQLYTFGWNAEGQLGRPTPQQSGPTPTAVSLPGIHGQIIQIAAGQNGSVALTSTGQVYAWGDNFYGELGNPTNNGMTTPNATPTLVTFPGLSGQVTQIAAGGTHTLALTSAGQLYAFGSNTAGELGTTTGLGPSTANPVPTLVPIPASAGKIVQIAAHLYSSLLVTATGQLYTFGNNAAGQLGYPTNTSNPNPTPTLVGLPGTPIRAVGVGGFAVHALAIVGSPGVTLSGVVAVNLDLEGTRFLIGVQVHITGHDTAGHAVDTIVTTDGTGHYALNVNPGTYTVTPIGSPPAQPAIPFDPTLGTSFSSLTPPPGLPYVSISGCTTGQPAPCTLTVAPGSTPTADFAYGDRHTLDVSFAPQSVRGDGFGQANVTVTGTHASGAPLTDTLLAGYVLNPTLAGAAPQANPRAWVCPAGQGLAYPDIATNSYPRYYPVQTDAAGRDTSLVFAGSAGGSVISYREGAIGTTLGADGIYAAPGLIDNPFPQSGLLVLTPSVQAGFTTTRPPEQPVSFNPQGLAIDLRRLMQTVGAPGGLATAQNTDGQAVQELLDWLVALKAAGYLGGVGFGPIDDPGTGGHPAVLFYREGDTALIPPDDITATLPNNELADGAHLVLDVGTARTLLARAGGLESLPTLGDWLRAERLRFVNTGLLTSGPGNFTPGRLERSFPKVYFGWPYPPPPTIPGAARFYQCSLGTVDLPQQQRLVVHSPLRLLVNDGHGHTLGFTKAGRSTHTLGGLFVVPRHGPQLYEFTPGHDQLTLTATGDGPAGIVVYPPGRTLGTPKVFTFPVRRGQTGTLSLPTHGHPRTLRFAGRTYRASGGVALHVTGVPRRLPTHASTLHLLVRDQFGEPVPGVVITITGHRIAVTAMTDSHGHATVRLPRTRTALRISLSAPTYQTLNRRIS